MSRCCGNCEWSISPEMEDLILEEQGYDSSAPDRPKAGDCCIGQEHNEEFYCSHHLYIEGMEEYENYVLYDDKYLGPGYLIVTKLGDEIVKFIKISLSDESEFPNIHVRAFESDISDNLDKRFREIRIEINRNEPLYESFFDLAHSLNGRHINSIDQITDGKSHLYTDFTMDTVSIVAVKDLYGVKESTNSVDISLGDNYSCEFYSEFMDFYHNLSEVSIGKTKDEDIKQLLLLK